MRSKKLDALTSKKILRIMSSESARKILEDTSKDERSVSQISEACNLPLTKTYRWIKKLQDLKLLEVTGTISEEGRKVKLFKSLVQMIIFNPRIGKTPEVEILGIGNKLVCSKCGSKNCSLELDEKTNNWEHQCNDCKQSFVETTSHKLKEEQQKVMLLEDSSHNFKEEQQKVILLQSLLDTK